MGVDVSMADTKQSETIFISQKKKDMSMTNAQSVAAKGTSKR